MKKCLLAVNNSNSFLFGQESCLGKNREVVSEFCLVKVPFMFQSLPTGSSVPSTQDPLLTEHSCTKVVIHTKKAQLEENEN